MSLLNKKKAGEINIHIPCEGTIRNVMDKIGLIHKPHRKPNGITKADHEAQKSDDLLKRDFSANKPLEKAVKRILVRSKQRTVNFMFRQYLTALT